MKEIVELFGNICDVEDMKYVFGNGFTKDELVLFLIKKYNLGYIAEDLSYYLKHDRNQNMLFYLIIQK